MQAKRYFFRCRPLGWVAGRFWKNEKADSAMPKTEKNRTISQKPRWVLSPVCGVLSVGVVVGFGLDSGGFGVEVGVVEGVGEWDGLGVLEGSGVFDGVGVGEGVGVPEGPVGLSLTNCAWTEPPLGIVPEVPDADVV